MQNWVRVKLPEFNTSQVIKITGEDKPDIPQTLIERWQRIINIIATLITVPGGLIMPVSVAGSPNSLCLVPNSLELVKRADRALSLTQKGMMPHLPGTLSAKIPPHQSLSMLRPLIMIS